MNQKYYFTVVLLVLFLRCSNSKIETGIYICEALNDSSKFSNSFCFYSQIEVLNSSFVNVKDKNGLISKGQIYNDDKGHLIITHSKIASENLILTSKNNGKTLEGRGYRFVKSE